MRGYFGLGVEGISKPRNVGALFRSAHAFGGSFVFAITPHINVREVYSADTSETAAQVPLHLYDSVAGMTLPKGCKLVGIELTDDAVELPSFRHPTQAAYVLGPERGSLSPELIERCDFTVKIPTKFCINVSVAGALVLYDRLISKGKFGARPMMPGGPIGEVPAHVHGPQKFRTEKK